MHNFTIGGTEKKMNMTFLKYLTLNRSFRGKTRIVTVDVFLHVIHWIKYENSRFVPADASRWLNILLFNRRSDKQWREWDRERERQITLCNWITKDITNQLK